MSTRRILRRDEDRSSSSPSPPPPRQRPPAGTGDRKQLSLALPAQPPAPATVRPSLVRATAADAWPSAAAAGWAPQRRRAADGCRGTGRDDCLQRWLRRLRLAFCCGAKAASNARGGSNRRGGAACRPLPAAGSLPPPLRSRCGATASAAEGGSRAADSARAPAPAAAPSTGPACEMALLHGRGSPDDSDSLSSGTRTPLGAKKKMRSSADRCGGWGYSDTASTSSSTGSLRSTSYFRSEESVSSSDSRCSSEMYTDERSCLSSARTSSVNASDEGTYRSPRRRRRKQPNQQRGGRGGGSRQRSWSNSSGSSSSCSSMTDSTVSLNVITVTISTDATNFLGISIVGQSGSSGDGGIYVGSVMHGGAVDLDGRIEAGDMILEVNGLSFDRLSNDEAVRLLRDAVKKPGPVTLVVAKCWEAGALMTSPVRGEADRHRNAVITPRQEPVRPIDPLAWVAHTTALQSQAAIMLAPQPPRTVPRAAAAAALPHRSAYECRRTAADGSTDSASTCSSADATLLPDAAYGASPRYASAATIGKLDAAAVVAAMARPDSGLDVRDRTWLKVTISSAFIGSDLVDWLLAKVQGFADRSDACSYAASLLKSGYIQHTVNKEVFSEQCYYIFGNASHGKVPSGSKSSYSNPTCSVSPSDVRPPSLPRYVMQQPQQPYAVTSVVQDEPNAKSASPWRGNQSGADRSFVSPSSIGQTAAATASAVTRPLLPRHISAVPADLANSRASFHAAMENPWDDLCPEQEAV